MRWWDNEEGSIGDPSLDVYEGALNRPQGGGTTTYGSHAYGLSFT